MARLFDDFAGGILTVDALTGGAMITSPALASLIEVAGDDWVDITIDPDGLLGQPEATRITSHAAAATTAAVDILTGDHLAGTRWVATVSQDALEGGLGGGGGSSDSFEVRVANSASPPEVQEAADIVTTNTLATDTALFQAAIDAAEAAGKNRVNFTFAKGNYYLGSLAISGTSPEFLLFRGEPHAKTARDDYGSSTQLFIDGPTAFLRVNKKVHVEFKYLEIEAGAYNETYTDQSALFQSLLGDYPAHFAFDHCFIADWNGMNAPLLSGRLDLVISHSTLYAEPMNESNRPTIRTTKSDFFGLVTDTFIEGYVWGGSVLGTESTFEIAPSGTTNFDDNDGYAGFTIRDCTMGGHYAILRASQFASDIVIADNSFCGYDDSSGEELPMIAFLVDCSRIRITGNTGANAGLLVANGCRDLSIRGNSMAGMYGNAVELIDTTDSIVSENIIVDPVGYGVLLSGGSSDNMVINNMIRSRANPSPISAAIRIEDATCVANVVRGNSLGLSAELGTPLPFEDNGTGTIT